MPKTLHVIQASALYDLIVTAAFATPWTAALAFRSLRSIHDTLGLSGALPSADVAFTTLFANLMGSLVVVWSVLRLVRPSRLLGVADTAARCLFALMMAFALAGGASTVLIGFLVAELAWALVQGGAVVSTRAADAPRVSA